ncbi:MAG: hypothetical protein IJN49_00640 [Clostridia bacterium]|nr:hypothetical protein [Clostridia bacterium]
MATGTQIINTKTTGSGISNSLRAGQILADEIIKKSNFVITLLSALMKGLKAKMWAMKIPQKYDEEKIKLWQMKVKGLFN